MIFRDQFQYAFGNLRKTRLRTTLTAAGVAIGIGAMTSMVSVGNGTQQNVLRAFNEQFLLTSITVRPSDQDSTTGERSALNQAAVTGFEQLPGVRAAYPMLTLPGLLLVDGQRLFRNLEGMPAWLLQEQIAHGRVQLVAGRAYQENEHNVMVLSERAAGRLLSDSVAPDTLVGRRVSFVLAQAAAGMTARPGAPANAPDALERFRSTTLDLTVVGIVKGGGTLADFVGASLWAPISTVEPFFGSAFQNLESVLTGEVHGDQYAAVQVLTDGVMSVRPIQDSLKARGFTTHSILDEIAEVRRAFVIMNGLLAMIGGVSLTVAAMMIVNTLVMAVLERTNEIGLLKSMGATDTDVMRLFLTEAGVIGLVGGAGGLVLGYTVARITNAIANFQFRRVGEVSVDLVAFSPWIILGGLAFALFVSLVAGVYPARRAARVDPVVALRHF